MLGNIRRTLLISLFAVSTFNCIYAQEIEVEAYPDRSLYPELQTKFTSFGVFQIPSAELNAYIQEERNVYSFKINITGEDLLFEMIPSEIVDASYTISINTSEGIITKNEPRARALRGIIVNRGGGNARLTIDENFIYGLFDWNGETYYIEPFNFLSQGWLPDDRFVVYKESDIRPTTYGTCGTDTENAGKYFDRSRNRSDGQCYQARIAIASDFSMYVEYGSDIASLEARNIGVMNNVQTNYIGEFDDDIEFGIVTQFISDCSTCDPWTSSSSSNALLNDFTDWGNSGGFGAGIIYDVASLWSDRDFDGSTIGLAWLNGLCGSLRYHVLQDFTSNANLIRVLTAHELGHNFSGVHDGSGTPFIMAPAVNNTNNWSTASINQISNFIDIRATNPNCFVDCGPINAPEPDFITLNENVCEGGVVYFYDQSLPAADEWEWTFPGGSPSSSEFQNPVITYNNPGTYPVTLTVSNNNGSSTETFSGVVSVGDDGSDILIYQDFMSGFQNWTVENNDGSVTWDIVEVEGSDFGNMAARMDNFNYNATGQRDAIISPPFDLIARFNATLNIDYAYRRFNDSFRDSLVVYVSTDGGQTFNNRIFAQTENGNGNFATNTDFNSEFTPSTPQDWCYGGSFGNGCLMLDLSQFLGEPNLVVKIENVNGFGNNMYLDKVYVQATCFTPQPPIAQFSADPTEGCATLTVNYTDESLNIPTSWLWTFEGGSPNTSTEQNPTVVYLSAGIYSTTLQVTNSEGSDQFVFDQLIDVNEAPLANIIHTVDGRTVNFVNGSQRHISQLWNFGDGESSDQENPIHMYAEDGVYTVTLSVTNECGTTTATETVVIDAQPTADFDQNIQEGCVPLTVTFTSNASNNTDDLEWFFEGGDPAISSEEVVNVTYENPGVFDVTLIASNPDGTDTLKISDAVVAGIAAEASFTFDIDLRTVDFNSDVQNEESIQWFFGDGSSSTELDPVHQYQQDGTYEAMLVAYNDCGNDTAIAEIVIEAAVSGEISASVTDGCIPLTVEFSDDGSQNVTARLWTFEGGMPGVSTESNPSVTYSDAGEYSVTLIVTNGLDEDTVRLENYINVGAPPDAGFDITQDALTIEFTNNSSSADSFSWTFGDGNSSSEENPTHTYTEDGVYTVRLIAENSCGRDTAERVVSIGTLPAADFEVTRRSGCIPFEVSFENLSSANAENFQWRFPGGNPSTSIEENPVVSYISAGVYSVELIVSNGEGSDTLLRNNYITVIPDPTVGFTFDISDFEVSFTSQATLYSGLFWDFGDGNFSTEENPVHTYMEVGSYEVEFTVYNSCDTLSETRTILIGEPPRGDFQADTTTACAPATIQFIDESIGEVDEWIWSFEGGTPNASVDQDPIITYNDPGTYDIQLIVRNDRGADTIVKTEYIAILEGPRAAFDFVATEGLVSFENNSEEANDYFWDFGNDSTSTDVNPIVEYTETGDYPVVLMAMNECGVDTSTQTVSIMIDAVVQNQLQAELKLFPNPTSSLLTVAWEGLEAGHYQFNVVDNLGQVVLRRSVQVGAVNDQLIMDMSALSPGVYYLNIEDGVREAVLRFIIL